MPKVDFDDLSFGCMDRTSAVNVTEYISSWAGFFLTSDSSLSSRDIVCYLGAFLLKEIMLEKQVLLVFDFSLFKIEF